jgi:hypothetical protein
MKLRVIIIVSIMVLILLGSFPYTGKVISDKIIGFEKKLISSSLFEIKKSEIKEAPNIEEENLSEEINYSEKEDPANQTFEMMSSSSGGPCSESPVQGIIKVKFKKNVNVETSDLAKEAIELASTNDPEIKDGIIIEKKT